MNYYKPYTLEENYYNIMYLQQDFIYQVKGYIWKIGDVVSRYQNPQRYYQFLALGAINPYINGYEREMRDLAYDIWGFTSCVYETLAYALDYWQVHINYKPKYRVVTDKEYDKSIALLKEKRKINGEEKETLLKFRKDRNSSAHYGRIQFCRYIFDNYQLIWKVISIIKSLLEDMRVNFKDVEKFREEQCAMIEEMKEVFEGFEQCSYILA